MLAVLLAGFILAAACTSPSVPAGSMEKTEVPVITQSAAINTPPSIRDSSHYSKEENNSDISITPVADHYLGDTILFNGTTTLSPGDTLTLEIVTTSLHSCQKTRYPCRDPDTVNAVCCDGGFKRTIEIRAGNGGINTWSYAVNTSEYDFLPEMYTVYLTSGNTTREQFFTILEKPKPPVYWLYITSVELPRNEHTMIIRGTTNLPVVEKLTVWIGQEPYHTCTKTAAGSCTDSVRACCGGIIRTAYVQQGKDTVNTWSLTMNTSEHGFEQGDEYEIRVSDPDFPVENASRIVLSA